MNQRTKFSTFGGVFTPSILTTLGVIMYLRLPWIVGQAGLWMTIGIIAVAHVISVTTGLSVSSIATDKRVRIGGNYYIISRSLGLSIGGTLGIALFVGLSFSVSLYIIGFVESFLPAIGIEPTKMAVRLYGTGAMLAVAAIVLISTSLAIKTQYFIMAAIALSLVSVVMGVSPKPVAAPALERLADGQPLMVLFGIFFPAVTGFTAGVQMSGDLQDPKKSIPLGTMLSIGVGLITYIGLATFLAYRVDVDSLVGNTNVLQDVARVPALLYAGIWGATLSSAMGSLMGAPRILQATSLDRITPRIFGRGYGATNEPRNALVMTLLIAEAGILIGELNLIAAIISIFFITTYGFINLSCAIESWASADFRPSFRIPTWVSGLGAAASFIVMIELDLLSFAGATIIMGILYLYLKRKELSLESGDTWEGVWASVIRSGLRYLSQAETHVRNWRPNIILFSGGTSSRPHLIEFGRWIVRTRGMLSNFDLIESSDGKVLFQKGEQAQHESEETLEGVFSRRLECGDIYDGMQSIAQVYGFSGLEPNTVLMGWARNSQDPDRFTQLLAYFRQLDYNVLLLDHDEERGFGRRQRIDIWWRGGNNNATLALAILKYLMIADEWQDAEARILVLLDSSPMVNRVRRNMMQMLEDQRLTATVKVINNAIDQASFTDVIRRESAESDLVIIGIGHVEPREATEFVESINRLVADIGSTLLVHASGFFEPLYVGIEEGDNAASDAVVHGIDSIVPIPALPEADFEAHERLAFELSLRHQAFEAALSTYAHDHLHSVRQLDETFAAELGGLVDRSLTTLEKRVDEESGERLRRSSARIQADCLFHLHRRFEQYQTGELPAQQEHWEAALEGLRAGLGTVVGGMGKSMVVHHSIADITTIAGDSMRLRLTKFGHRLRHRMLRHAITVRVPYRDLGDHHVEVTLGQALYAAEESLGIESYRFVASLQKWLRAVGDALGYLERKAAAGELAAGDVQDRIDTLKGQLRLADEQHREELEALDSALISAHRRGMQSIYGEVLRIDAPRRVAAHFKVDATAAQLRSRISEAPAQWHRNATLISSYALIELSLMVAKNRITVLLGKVTDDVMRHIQTGVLDRLAKLETTLTTLRQSDGAEGESGLQAALGAYEVVNTDVVAGELLRGVQASVDELPETVEIIVEETFQQLETRQFDQVDTLSIDLRRLVHYVVETELVEPFQERLAQLPGHALRGWRSAGDVARLVRFRLENVTDTDDVDAAAPQESLEAIIDSCQQRLIQEREPIEAATAAFLEGSRKLLGTTFEKLDPYLLTRSADNMGHYIRSQESRRVILGFEVGRKRLRTLMTRGLVRLLYGHSEGVLLARRLHEVQQEGPADVGGTLDLAEKLSPPPRVLSSLPLYYRQLFTGNQPIGEEYWVGRRDELKRATTVVHRHQRGYTGGVLVVGGPETGKTALCRRIVATHVDARRVHRIIPPEGGTADLDVFRASLLESLGGHGDPRHVLAALPRDSAILLPDLELWWERHPEGYEVIDEILWLIDEFSGHCLFVAHMNTHAYRFLARVRPLSRAFLDTIACEPFDAEQLQEAILVRHRSTGLRFELDGKQEDQLSDFTIARFFSALFEQTAGSIGGALRTWVACIEEVDGERLRLRRPDRPSLSALDRLSDEDRVWLRQVVLHKRLTPQRLARLFRMDEITAHRRAIQLQRMGLLVESSSGAVALHPYLYPFIIQHLDEREML